MLNPKNKHDYSSELAKSKDNLIQLVDSDSTIDLKDERMKQNYKNFVAGGLAGAISRSLVAPLERLKTLYQVNYIGNSQHPPPLWKGLLDIYQKDGIRGYWRGNLTNLIKSTPELAIRLYSFEKIKYNLQLLYGENLSKTGLFFSGSMAGVIAIVIVFPLEVIKVRISAAQNNHYNGIIDAFLKIRKEGMKTFYKGLEVNLLNVIPNAGLNLTAYELLKRFFSGKSSPNNGSFLSTPVLMFIGAASALFSSTIMYPFQTIQSRIIMNNINDIKLVTRQKDRGNKYLNISMINVIQNTYHLEGMKGFYKGYLPGISKILMGNAFGFAFYEKIKVQLT